MVSGSVEILPSGIICVFYTHALHLDRLPCHISCVDASVRFGFYSRGRGAWINRSVVNSFDRTAQAKPLLDTLRRALRSQPFGWPPAPHVCGGRTRGSVPQQRAKRIAPVHLKSPNSASSAVCADTTETDAPRGRSQPRKQRRTMQRGRSVGSGGFTTVLRPLTGGDTDKDSWWPLCDRIAQDKRVSVFVSCRLRLVRLFVECSSARLRPHHRAATHTIVFCYAVRDRAVSSALKLGAIHRPGH